MRFLLQEAFSIWSASRTQSCRTAAYPWSPAPSDRHI